MLTWKESFDYIKKKFPGFGSYGANHLRNGLIYFSLFYESGDDFAGKSFTFDPKTKEIVPFEMIDTLYMDEETAKGYEIIDKFPDELSD